MAALHIRMAILRQHAQQHPNNRQSISQRFAIRFTKFAARRRSHNPQYGLQGGKDCGRYHQSSKFNKHVVWYPIPVWFDYKIKISENDQK